MELRTLQCGKKMLVTGHERPGSYASIGKLPLPGDVVVCGDELVRVRRIRIDRRSFISVILDPTAKHIADCLALGEKADCSEVGLGWVFPVQHWSWHGAH